MHCIVLYNIILYCIVLYCIISYSIVLYCIVFRPHFYCFLLLLCYIETIYCCCHFFSFSSQLLYFQALKTYSRNNQCSPDLAIMKYLIFLWSVNTQGYRGCFCSQFPKKRFGTKCTFVHQTERAETDLLKVYCATAKSW